MEHHSGDLTHAPLAYPGEPVAGPRLVLADCEHVVRPRLRLGASQSPWCATCSGAGRPGARRLLGAALDELGAAPLAERTPVLAVGSNASADVVRHKLASRGVPVVVPVLTGVVRGLGVAHSAHVSRAGYVPAAPVHRARARTRVVLQLLDDDQLAAVDETEPTYERVELTATRYPVVLSGGLRPSRVHVYAGRFGVVHLPGRAAERLLPQHDILRALDRAGVPHTGGGPAAAARRLAASEDARVEARDAMRRLGLVRPHRLHHRPATTLRWRMP
ncbi:hypothetical protein JQN72_15385 [Phycicoccus sp. CSK15P-2]|uniref:hypothetical protein n=1 Tax=Phycicoccus sp. CSK15P-2 TaxID=2807627 RepID=UPI00195044DF|nr:hypothetical protein [Phycicoccus sp. CSK15P-2]MBM6405625.1 hypothetical protein [Phycicoccus sp. CSK15P-2]